MKIEYENKFSDILLFNAFHQFLSPVTQAIFLLFPFFIFKSELNESSVYVAVFSAGTIYLAMWLLQMVFNVIYFYSKKDKLRLTKHLIEIQDEALFEETKYSRSFFYWDGIVKVVRRPGFVAVYLTSHLAHIIPLRAFSSIAHSKEFIDAINRKLNAV